MKTLTTLLAVMLLFLCLSITLKEFLFTDDIQNFQLRNAYKPAHPETSWLEFALEENKSWMADGRFTPVTFLWQELVYFHVPTVMAYRWFLLFMNILGAAAFLFFLHTLNTRINPALWLLCYCALLQFRIQYHDAYTSTHGMYQMLAVFVFTSLGFYVLYVKQGRWYYLVAALFLYLCAHLHCEVGIAAFVFLPATMLLLKVAYAKAFKQFAPFALVTVIYLAYSLWLKLHVVGNNAYEGLQANVEPMAMLTVLGNQLFAALPLSNLYSQAFIPNLLMQQAMLVPYVLAGVIAVSTTVYFLLMRRPDKMPVLRLGLVLFFFLLMLVPAVFITPSLKYQQQIKTGVGYLPVYLQNMGTAALLSYLISCLSVSARPVFKFTGRTLGALVVLCVVVTMLFNNALLRAGMFECSTPSLAQFKAIKNGIAKNVPDHSLILSGYFWKAGYMYQDILTNMGKNVWVINEEDFRPGMDTTRNPCFLMETVPGPPVQTTIYNVDCSTGNRLSVFSKQNYAGGIQLTKEESLLLHRY